MNRTERKILIIPCKTEKPIELRHIAKAISEQLKKGGETKANDR